MSLSIVPQQVCIETRRLHSSKSRLGLEVSVSEENVSGKVVVSAPLATGHSPRHEPAVCCSVQAAFAGQSLCSAERNEENDSGDSSVVSASSATEVISAQVGRTQCLTTEDLKRVSQHRCERCGAEHDRSFGSGRFCSVQCARRVAAKAKWERYHDRKRRALSAEQIGAQPEDVSVSPVYEPTYGKRIRPNGKMPCTQGNWEMNGTRVLQTPLQDYPQMVLTPGNPPPTQLQNGSILMSRLAAEFCLPRERYARWSWRFPHGGHRMEQLTAPVCQLQVSDETQKRNSVALPPFSVAFADNHGLSWSQPAERTSRALNRKQSLPSFIEVSRFAKSVNSTWSVLRNSLTDPLRYRH